MGRVRIFLPRRHPRARGIRRQAGGRVLPVRERLSRYRGAGGAGGAPLSRLQSGTDGWRGRTPHPRGGGGVPAEASHAGGRRAGPGNGGPADGGGVPEVRVEGRGTRPVSAAISARRIAGATAPHPARTRPPV